MSTTLAIGAVPGSTTGMSHVNASPTSADGSSVGASLAGADADADADALVEAVGDGNVDSPGSSVGDGLDPPLPQAASARTRRMAADRRAMDMARGSFIA
jgi:hypothetical protein